ncbi:hypothetical protein K440DRAFT_362443 [Wilcoxina mikolae CBS 423.85]|nr:hypothetical protein K440DRAFT_362443 [Wilcoxina mikolae CBS 423.85]
MVYSISRSLPAPVPRASPPHYQTFLTPLLHRRFAHACLISLGVCYLDAFLVSDKSNPFWVVFPVSWTGVKCVVLFFLSAMPILILRIAQLHVVKRANPSPFHTLQRSIGSFSTYTTIFTYLGSSVVFTILYLLSSNDTDQLGIVIEGRSYERPRLNERFLYLIFFSAYIGVLQGIYHVAQDRARLEFPDVPITSYKEAARRQLPLLGWNVGVLTAVSAVTGPLAYLPFRHIFWSYTLWFARQFYWLNRSAALPAYPVGPGLFIRSGVIAFLTCLSAEIAHVAFTSFFIENPFQTSKVVSDKSSDPNGTLVTGLRSTKAPLTQ